MRFGAVSARPAFQPLLQLLPPSLLLLGTPGELYCLQLQPKLRTEGSRGGSGSLSVGRRCHNGISCLERLGMSATTLRWGAACAAGTGQVSSGGIVACETGAVSTFDLGSFLTGWGHGQLPGWCGMAHHSAPHISALKYTRPEPTASRTIKRVSAGIGLTCILLMHRLCPGQLRIPARDAAAASARRPTRLPAKARRVRLRGGSLHRDDSARQRSAAGNGTLGAAAVGARRRTRGGPADRSGSCHR